MGHLVIEKLLKALIVARQPEGSNVPLSHDLLLLACRAGLEPDRRHQDLRIEPHPFLPSEFTEENPMAREVMRTGIRIV